MALVCDAAHLSHVCMPLLACMHLGQVLLYKQVMVTSILQSQSFVFDAVEHSGTCDDSVDDSGTCA